MQNLVVFVFNSHLFFTYINFFGSYPIASSKRKEVKSFLISSTHLKKTFLFLFSLPVRRGARKSLSLHYTIKNNEHLEFQLEQEEIGKPT